MTPEEVLTSLQRLSAPGYNRAVGSGDVSPYRSSTDPTAIGGNAQTASDAVAATPGASGMWGAPSTPQPFDPNSFLNNLSAFMPMISQLLQTQQPAVRSGVGDATATPTATAVGGPSSADLGGMNIAGAQAPSPAPSLAPTAPALPYGAQWDPYAYGGANIGSGEGAPGAPGGPGAGPGAPGGPAGGPGGSDGGGIGDGSGGVYKQGGMVTQGNPKSKTDDVSAKLQHGEFVIPRDAVHHLAATAPEVLSHVMHVSALHALANNAKGSQPSPGARLTGQNGGMPPMASGGPVGYRDGGLVLPSGVAPQIHPEVMNRIRQAIAMHAAPSAGIRPVAGPAQMAQMGPTMASQGRPPVLPPLTPRPRAGYADGGFVDAEDQSSRQQDDVFAQREQERLSQMEKVRKDFGPVTPANEAAFQQYVRRSGAIRGE